MLEDEDTILYDRLSNSSICNGFLTKFFDIYGFTEQLGTVYVSRGLSGCRSSAYSEVLVRDIVITAEDGETYEITLFSNENELIPLEIT